MNRRPLRVVLLNHNLIERGTYFRARETARLFHGRGHNVTLVTTGKQYYRPRYANESERYRELHTGNWPLAKGPDDGIVPFGMVGRLLSLRRSYDLIYTFSHKPVDLWPAQWLRRRGGYWLADWCDLWSRDGGVFDTSQWVKPWPPMFSGVTGAINLAINRWEERLEEKTAIAADGVSIIATWMRTQTRRLGIPDENVVHYVSGADTERIPVRDKGECRALLGMITREPVIGYVANYTLDNFQLMDALEILWKKYPRAQFLMAGPRFYTDGSIVENAARRGLVRDLGRVPFAQVPMILGASDLLVCPMRETNFNRSRWPHKFGDYLSAGRPIATTRVGDIAGIVEAHALGAVGAPTAAGLAEAMESIIMRRDEWGAMGRRGRNLAETTCSWPARFEGLVEFLRGKGMEV